MEEKILTVTEISERMKVSIQTVRNWIKQGKLKADKIPKGLVFEYRIKETDLQDFIDKNMKL